jgi:Sec-independent protein translocase protein TatA
MVFEAIWRCLEQMAEAVKKCVARIRKSQSDEKKESSHEQDNSDSHEIGSTGGKGAMQARPQNNNQDHSTPNDAVSRDANDNSLSIMIRSGTSAAAEENETRALFSELPGYIPPTPPGNATASFRAELRKRLLEVGQVRPN